MLQLLMVSLLFIIISISLVSFVDVIRMFSESFLPNSYILSPFPEMGTFCKSFVVRYLGHKEIKDNKSEIYIIHFWSKLSVLHVHVSLRSSNK